MMWHRQGLSPIHQNKSRMLLFSPQLSAGSIFIPQLQFDNSLPSLVFEVPQCLQNLKYKLIRFRLVQATSLLTQETSRRPVLHDEKQQRSNKNVKLRPRPKQMVKRQKRKLSSALLLLNMPIWPARSMLMQRHGHRLLQRYGQPLITKKKTRRNLSQSQVRSR